MEFNIPSTCNFVASNNTETGHVWTVQFAGGERATVTATNNPNKTVTYRILELMFWFCSDRAETEAMIAQYAEVGNWEQEK